jgi:hypothetical protein
METVHNMIYKSIASFLLTGILLFVPFTTRVQTQESLTSLERAAELFEQSKHKEAIPILEKIVAATPDNDQAVFGLGVGLVMIASRMEDTEARQQIIAQAHSALQAAKNLGVDDFFLDRGLKDLSIDAEDVKREAVESLATLWTLHPPLVFDNEPPRGIQLPNGYRHKNSRDFEGLVGGVIWKPGGLKIEYEFAGQFQTDAVIRFDRSQRAWYEERLEGDHKFKCVLTKDNWLAISVMIVEDEENSIASFGCQVSNKGQIEEVYSIVSGLQERLSEL